MKKAIVILIGLCILSCSQEKSSKPDLQTDGTEHNNIIENDEQFNWLVGNWKKLDNDTENKTFENWNKKTNTTFLGHGFIMKELDTIWQEKMTLIKNDSTWVLKVETPGNDDLVKFKLTEYNHNSFTVTNPEHDFPKEIKYWKNENKLNATVKGDGHELQYEFERLK